MLKNVYTTISTLPTVVCFVLVSGVKSIEATNHQGHVVIKRESMSQDVKLRLADYDLEVKISKHSLDSFLSNH